MIPRSRPAPVQDLVPVAVEPDTFRRIVESVLSGVVLADERGAIILTNSVLARLFGYAPGELVGRRLADLVPDLDAAPPTGAPMALRAVGRPSLADRTVEVSGHRKDGSVFPLEVAASSIVEGERLLFVGVIRDITDRRSKEAELATERRLLRQAQRIARLGNWESEPGLRRLRWSPAVYEIFGEDPDSFSPSRKSLRAAVHPEDRMQLDAALLALDQGERVDVVLRILRPDGATRYLNLRGGDPAGEGQSLLQGVIQDITDLKLAESALQGLTARQRVQLEAAHCLRYVTKYALDDLLTDVEMLSACAHRIGSGCRAAASGAVRIRHGDITVETDCFAESDDRLEVPIPFFDAGTSRIEVHRNPTVGSEFTPADKMLLRDIARQIGQSLIRRADRRALVEAKEEAEAANRAKSNFLSSMSHELRTPLNAILGFAQVLEIDGSLNEDQLDSVRTIRKSGQHLLQLINEVLDLARVEAGQLQLSIEDVGLDDVFGVAGKLVAPLAAARGISVEFRRDAAVCGVRADHTRLKQVLFNLLSNAVKYNRPGGRIVVSASRVAPDSVRISVSDTGMGIPAGRMKELFRPFSRLGAEDSAVEGTGIGLVISKHFVEAMDGSIGVSSSIGEGSEFWFELVPAISPAPADPVALGPVEALPPGRILYIEDNPANLKLVRHALAHHPQVELLEAQTGAQGLVLARQMAPTLILLDINMPGMSGLDVMRRLQGDPATRSIPVVAISAAAMDCDVERALAAGMRRYLTKPIDVQEFLDVVRSLLAEPDRRSRGDRRRTVSLRVEHASRESVSPC